MILFDDEYYALLYPGYKERSALPIVDYLKYGWKEGANPSPLFNSAHYLREHPEIAGGGESPLEHCARLGNAPAFPSFPDQWQRMSAEQKRHLADIGFYLAAKAGLFDPDYYRSRYGDIPADADALGHYRTRGRKEGRIPSALFEYCAPTEDDMSFIGGECDWPADQIWLATALANPETRKIIISAGIFSKDYYEFAYPEVRGNSRDSFLHFMLHGWRRGYNPSPGFNTRYYLENYPDARGNPVFHCLAKMAAGENPHTFPQARDFPLLADYVRDHAVCVSAWELVKLGWFDGAWYSENYPDIENLDPWLHYRKFGIVENRMPSPNFNSPWYLAEYLNGDPMDCAIWHYLNFGRENGLSARPNDRLQILMEENSLLFEQIYTLQNELKQLKAKISQMENKGASA